MTALLTQCPHCQTSFRVSSAQLKAAKGLVRCGSCLGVFSAAANEIRIKAPDGYVIEELDALPDDADESSVHEQQQPAQHQPAQPHTEPVTPVAAVSTPVTAMNAQDDLPPWEEPPVTPTDWTPDDAFEEDLPEADLSEETLELEDLHAVALTAQDPLEEDSLQEAAEPEEPGLATEEPDHASLHALAPDEFEPALGDLSLDELYDDEDDEDEETGEEEYTAAYEPDDTAHNTPFDSFDDSTHADDDVDDDGDDEDEPDPSPEPPFTAPTTPLRAERQDVPGNKRDVHSSLVALRDDEELAPVTDDDLDNLDAEPVTLVQGASLRSRVATTLLVLTNLVLLLALPLPWLYVHRNELPTHPRFAFLAPLVCDQFGCEAPVVPPTAGPTLGSMYTQQLLVRSHPRAANALEVSFVFHNDATQPQPFPALELAFSDPSNKLMANRLFQPDEYLPPELRHLSAMPAQTTVQVQLELADPGSDAVNYKVVLHPR